MAEHTPTTETVRDCFVDGAAGDFIEEDFDRWLAAHDAELRAEVERLRGIERGWQHDRSEWESERNAALARATSAEQERDEVRALAAEMLTTFTEPGYPGVASHRTGWVKDTTLARWRDLLAGPGEQPGEGRGPVRDGWCCWTCADLAAAADPAPAVSDSADMGRARRLAWERYKSQIGRMADAYGAFGYGWDQALAVVCPSGQEGL